MAFVQGASAQSQPSVASLTATFAAGVTTGNTVWGGAVFASSVATITVTVGGVSATVFPSVTDAGNGAQAVTFILGNISGAPTAVTMSFSPNTTFVNLIAIEESGCLAASNPSDGHTGQIQNVVAGANTISSGNITTTVANDIIVGVCSNDAGGTLNTAGTSPLAFTLRTTLTGIGASLFTEDGAILATPGSVAATFGQPAANINMAFVIAIKPAITSQPVFADYFVGQGMGAMMATPGEIPS